MIYPEFDKYTPYVDKENPFCNAYTTKEGQFKITIAGGFVEVNNNHVNLCVEC